MPLPRKLADTPAFPSHGSMGEREYPGMSLRQYFSIYALVGMETWCPMDANGNAPAGMADVLQAKAQWAIAQADALIALLEKNPSE